MKESSPLLDKPLQFCMLPMLCPSESSSDAGSGSAAAFLIPACSESNRYASQEDVSQGNRRLLLHGLDGFGNDVFRMRTKRTLQDGVKSRHAGDAQGSSSVPLRDCGC